MKKVVVLPLLASLLLCFAACGGNRYYKNYTGERLEETSSCRVISLVAEEMSVQEKIEEIESQGYVIIGKSEHVNYGGRKYEKKLSSACRKLGGEIALYANKGVIYFASED